MSAVIVRSTVAAPAHRAGGPFRRRLTSRSDVKRACERPQPQPPAHARRPRMSAVIARSTVAAPAHRAGGPSRRRLTSRSDVKRAIASGCSQNRQLMRGGRA